MRYLGLSFRDKHGSDLALYRACGWNPLKCPIQGISVYIQHLSRIIVNDLKIRIKWEDL